MQKIRRLFDEFGVAEFVPTIHVANQMAADELAFAGVRGFVALVSARAIGVRCAVRQTRDVVEAIHTSAAQRFVGAAYWPALIFETNLVTRTALLGPAEANVVFARKPGGAIVLGGTTGQTRADGCIAMLSQAAFFRRAARSAALIVGAHVARGTRLHIAASAFMRRLVARISFGTIAVVVASFATNLVLRIAILPRAAHRSGRRTIGLALILKTNGRVRRTRLHVAARTRPILAGIAGAAFFVVAAPARHVQNDADHEDDDRAADGKKDPGRNGFLRNDVDAQLHARTVLEMVRYVGFFDPQTHGDLAIHRRLRRER